MEANLSKDSSGSSLEEGIQCNNSTNSPSLAKLFPIFQKDFKAKKPDPLRSIQLEIQKRKKNGSGKMKSLLGKKETPGLTQTVIDAGQKIFGPRICSECGLLYSPGDAEDEEEHRKAHTRLENLFSITLWKDVRIVHNYSDGGQIIMIQCNSESKRVMNRLNDFLAWVDSELGAGDACGKKSNERIFLYVVPIKRKNTVRILGCAVMEVICPETTLSFSLGEEINPGRTLITIGVTRLWTDKGFRRKSIASRLCEMMRFHSGIPGCIISKHQIGILEPSEAGRAFMTKYTESKGSYYSCIPANYTSASQ